MNQASRQTLRRSAAHNVGRYCVFCCKNGKEVAGLIAMDDVREFLRAASLLLFIVLGTGLVLMACGSKSLADSRTAGSDSYGLNAESMTGTDSYQMELQEGEVLAVHFETVRGSMCMEIQAPDGSPLYQGNGKGVTEFTVNIPESGTYSIFVEAHRAKGIIQVQRKEERN